MATILSILAISIRIAEHRAVSREKNKPTTLLACKLYEKVKLLYNPYILNSVVCHFNTSYKKLSLFTTIGINRGMVLFYSLPGRILKNILAMQLEIRGTRYMLLRIHLFPDFCCSLGFGASCGFGGGGRSPLGSDFRLFLIEAS